MKFNIRSLFKPRRTATVPDAVSADVRFKEGLALHQNGQLAHASASFEQVLQLQPSHFDAMHMLGVIAYQSRNYTLAVALIDKAINLNPGNALFYSNRGLALQALKQLGEALASYDQSIKRNADFAEAYYNRGNALKELMRFEEALASYDRAISLKADFAVAHNNRGATLQALRRFDEALASYDQAIRCKPGIAESYNNRGATLQALKRFDEALESFDQAIKFKPDYAEAYSNRGVTLKTLMRLDEALASYGHAIMLNADYADAYGNRGVALQALSRFSEALASYDIALKLDPDDVEAHVNRGNVLAELNRMDEALKSYHRALKLRPDYDFLFGICLHARMKFCDWQNMDNEIADLMERIKRNEKASPPFAVLALTGAVAIQRKAAEIWTNDKYPENRALPAIEKRARHDRIRVGYYSADFRNHAVSVLMAGVFETHDRSRFECTAFSYGPDTKDDMRKRAERAFDKFIDVRDAADKEVALLSRRMEIDIAVDLGGGTQNARTGIFAMRTAPLQVSYIGYAGTMGANYLDYLIADKTIVPDDHLLEYPEKIIYLPSYQANDSKRIISERRFTRAELGLPDAGFVFCCFNNSYKITPATFDVWMRILRRTQGSVLLLSADNEAVAANLKKEAAVRGVQAGRLVFVERLPAAEYLARYRVADLFLDTFPCNAGTTASDALWAGLPVVTCMGDAFASRLAASLLNAIGLPELITTTPEQFEALAVELAVNPGKLSRIRRNLVSNRLTTPLFDTRLFTRHLEAGYSQIYERYQADLPPAHIHAGQ